MSSPDARAQPRAPGTGPSDEYQARNARVHRAEGRAALGHVAASRVGARDPRRRRRQGRARARLRRGAVVDPARRARRAGRRARQLGARSSSTPASTWPPRGRLPARRTRAAEEVPLPDASFDVVFCDHGAMTFGDPYQTVPEAARLLRPGRAVRVLALDAVRRCAAGARTGSGRAAARSGRTSGCTASTTSPDEPTEFNLPYGEWIRLFREHGFRVEALRRGAAAGGRRVDLPAAPRRPSGRGRGRWRRSGDAGRR